MAPQFDQAVSTELGKANHAAFIDGVGALGTVAEHRKNPARHCHIEMRSQDEWCVSHEEPSHGLHWNTGSGPGRGVTRRNLARVGEAGFHSRAGLTIDDRHFVTCRREIPRGRDADHAAAENRDFHAAFLKGFAPV